MASSRCGLRDDGARLYALVLYARAARSGALRVSFCSRFQSHEAWRGVCTRWREGPPQPDDSISFALAERLQPDSGCRDRGNGQDGDIRKDHVLSFQRLAHSMLSSSLAAVARTMRWRCHVAKGVSATARPCPSISPRSPQDMQCMHLRHLVEAVDSPNPRLVISHSFTCAMCNAAVAAEACEHGLNQQRQYVRGGCTSA